MGRKRKQESDPQPTTLEEIQEANTLLTGEAVLQFHPPSPELAPDEQGELRAREGKGWIKLSFDFRNFLDRLRGARLSIFLDICLHINESGWAWPSLKTICRETGYNRDTAMAVIAYLTHETGILEITQTKGRVNKYRPSFAAYGKSGKFRPVVETTTTPAEVVVKTTTTTSGSFSDSKKNHGKKNQKEKEPSGAKKPRPRDPLFDAIAEVCETDPTIKGNGSSIGTVRQALLDAEPPYTPDEVRAYGRLTWHKPPTLWQLKAEIGLVRNGKAHQGQPPIETNLSPAEQEQYEAWVKEYESQR